MKIGIDVSMIDENKAGIGYYAYSLVLALSQTDINNQYYLFTFNKTLLKDLQLPNNFSIIEVNGKGNLKWMFKCLPIIRKLKLDQFFSPSNLFWGCVLNNCTTVIHDIAQIIHPEFFYRKGNIFYRIELSLLLRRRGIVITPSVAVKNDILKFYRFVRAPIYTIKEGLHEWALEAYDENKNNTVKGKYSLPDNYLLTVGTLEPRKNLIAVIMGFKEFLKEHSDYKLVVVGKKGWFYEEIYNTVKENSLDDSVMFLGYVPDTDLASIYDLSTFVISLSFHEGFGLPLIEANSRNKAVLASNIAVYRELDVVGEYVELTSSPIEISEKMAKLVNLNSDNANTISDTYSWKKVTKELLDIWHQ